MKPPESDHRGCDSAVSWVMLGIFAGLAVALTLVALTVVLG